MSQSISNRYDFVYLFDVKDGNPNGDPDAGNMPRIDPDTGNGLVTDVCLKRKIRDFVLLTKNCAPPFDIWVKSKSLTLNEQVERAYAEDEEVKNALAAWEVWSKQKKKGNKPPRHYEDIAKDWMCRNFFDIRTFGAVMSTSDKDSESAGGESKIKKTAGQVRGPVQMTFARSRDRVSPVEHSISVCAARKADKPVEAQIGIQGRKSTIPYGLYLSHGFVSAPLAAQTGFGEEDLALLWEALKMMFEHDRSAARGLMSAQKLFVFKHDSALGAAPAGKLFERIKVVLKDDTRPPRTFSDYEVSVERAGLPAGVELIEML